MRSERMGLMERMKARYEVVCYDNERELTEYLNRKEAEVKLFSLEQFTPVVYDGCLFFTAAVSWMEPDESVEVGEPELPLE